jgi:hypothetical protein
MLYIIVYFKIHTIINNKYFAVERQAGQATQAQ